MAERTITCLVQPPWKARTRPLSARKDLKERKRVEKRGRQREGAKETERERMEGVRRRRSFCILHVLVGFAIVK